MAGSGGKIKARERGDHLRRGNVPTMAFKLRVREAFDYRCEYCGAREPYYPGPQQVLNVDRITPAVRGGLYLPRNVTCACRPCNSKKRDKDFIGPVRSLADMEASRG